MANKKETIYIWKGKKQGKKTQGETSGDSPAIIKAQLRRQGIIVSSIKKKPQPISFGGGGISQGDIAIFTRQMATMIRTGVPLVQALGMVKDGLKNKLMQSIINEIEEDVASGTPFAESLAKYPKYFDDLYCSLIDAGEQSGALDQLLDRVATYKEKSELLRKKIKKALSYPISVLVVAIVVTSILLIKVVPTFAETFAGFGAELPAFTLFVLGISNFVQAMWWKILLVLIALGFGYKTLLLKSKKFASLIDAISLKIPVVGLVVYNGVVARFARTLSTTFSAGVPLVEALKSVSRATGNSIYEAGLNKIRDEVTGGTPLNVAMRTSNLFPALAIQMTTIGEESGALDELLERVATHYEAEVDDLVDNLTSMLEPFIMCLLAVLVGGLLIAMYLPIFMLGDVV